MDGYITIKPVINFHELVYGRCKSLKSKKHFDTIRRFKHCFSGEYEQDLANANQIIDKTVSNNYAHALCTSFKFGFNHFYGINFNPKFLHNRPGEVSKKTTRLDVEQIVKIKEKWDEWIKEDIGNTSVQKWTTNARKKTYYCYETLLASGMRIGELCSIKWTKKAVVREAISKFSGKLSVEIWINTEKTCKRREVFIPIDMFRFFCKELPKRRLKIKQIQEGLRVFRKWSKLPFYWSAHSLRRTKASLMHEMGVDVPTIALVLGNSPKTVMNHYIIASGVNFEACDIANCLADGSIKKTNNIYYNPSCMQARG